MSGWLVKLKTQKTAKTLSDKTFKSPSVSSVIYISADIQHASPTSVSFVSGSPESFGDIEPETLTSSTNGTAEVEPVIEIPIQAWTPAGGVVTVIANDENHAKFIWSANPKPQPKIINLHAELPTVINLGIPEDLYILACRYCVELFGDGQEQAEAMIIDLFESENKEWWREHFKHQLGIPDDVRCVDCINSIDTGGNLSRCRRDVIAPGTGGLWWLDDHHFCPMFRRKE